ncbi:MAG: TonB-dependent receptor, partial [Gammaproteobacteria bacterium]
DNQMLDGRTREDGTSCGFGGCRYSRPADRKDSFENWSPKLGLSYQMSGSKPRENSLLFVNIARGFRAPQATELYRLQRQQTSADLESVQLDSYEAGFRFQSGLLNYELAYYQMYKDNVIYRDSSYFNLSNGKTDHQGLEIRVDYAINNALNLSVNGSFAQHQYANDQLIAGVNINGNYVDTAPRHFGAAQLNWAITDALLVELEWLHQGSYYMDAENLHRYQGHDLINLRADWQLGPQWSVNVRINNVTDVAYAERADYTSFTEERYFPGMPLSLFLGVQWHGG